MVQFKLHSMLLELMKMKIRRIMQFKRTHFHFVTIHSAKTLTIKKKLVIILIAILRIYLSKQWFIMISSLF